ncbi:hypothetical protein JW960_27490 [candidate division KSB1 bacterium]|nr:hypothetical protein [candidate division KSB1 bacterium]
MSKSKKKKHYVPVAPAKSQISPELKRVFSVIALLIPVIFILLLEGGLRLFNYGGDTRLFIDGPDELPQYYRCNPDVGKRYFFTQNTVPNPPKDLFLKTKPQNGYRIFVMGGSTTAGFPYGNNIMFSRILHQRLNDAFPKRHIEVINTAMSAVNSYTLLDFMDEIFDKQPDAILIYAGHNEYYGAMGVASMESLGKFRWGVKAFLAMQNFRIYRLMRDFVGTLKAMIGKSIHSGDELDPTNTLMARIVGSESIPYGSPAYELGNKQYRENLDEILGKAKNAGVPVIISELVCNLHDQQPFVSIDEIDSLSANHQFKIALSMERDHQYDRAKQAFYRAKDLDALRFRASEDINAIIHELADKYADPVVPMKSIFEQASPNRFIGNNLIFEHLHPNIDGYFLLADGFFNAMRENHFIGNDWDESLIQSAQAYHQTWPITALDSVYANLTIFHLKGGWPFKSKSTVNRSLIDYKPKNVVESVALKSLMDPDISLELAHVKLAEYYQQQGDIEAAGQEYAALMYTIPYEDDFVKKACESFMHVGKEDRALMLLESSLRYKPSSYASKMAATFLLKANRVNEAIPYLEQTVALQPTDSQMLFNLTQAYIYCGHIKQAMDSFQTLKRIEPNSAHIGRIEQLLARLKNRQ